MAIPRKKPYMFATWISKLLVGSKHCNWAVWYRTHFDFMRRDVDSTIDKMKHTAIVRKVEKELMDEGYQILNEVWFTVEGDQMDFSGVCDIVALKEDHQLICEVKSSANKYESDRAQLLLYIWGLPRAKDGRFRGMSFDGLLAYEKERIPVSAVEVDEVFMHLFRNYVRDLLDKEPAHKRPSYFECKYCNIAECDERQTNEDPPTPGAAYRPDFF